jgi:hypothetical protein
MAEFVPNFVGVISFHSPEGTGVAIFRLLQGHVFDQEAINLMVIAFEDTLRELDLANRPDPVVEHVARVIIECAERGMRDPAEMRNCALEAIRKGGQ